MAVVCALQTLAIMALVTQLLSLSQESWKQGFATEYCKLKYSFCTYSASQHVSLIRAAGEFSGQIDLERRAFINPLLPNMTSLKWEIQWEEGQPHYAGPPNAEIDAAWYKLMGGKPSKSQVTGIQSWVRTNNDGVRFQLTVLKPLISTGLGNRLTA